MITIRDWLPLEEAFTLIAKACSIKTNAQESLSHLPNGWDITDAINRVTESAMSEAGRTGILRFSGLRSEFSTKHFPVPTTWFEAQAGNTVTTPRGFDPDANQLWFAPLHQVQDEELDHAADFETKERAQVRRWYDVMVQTKALTSFLNMLGGTVPDAVPIVRRPSAGVIKKIITKLNRSGKL